MKKIFLIMTILLFSFNNYAQHEQSSLFLSLQKGADSTLVIEDMSNWIKPLQLRIVSKKRDSISTYTYEDGRMLYNKSKIFVPEGIKSDLKIAYNKIKYEINYTPLAVNLFFHPRYISVDSARLFWEGIIEANSWSIKEAEECSESEIYDGGYVVLYRITKDKIEKLSFYAPAYYESETRCSGDPNRQAILKIEQLFNRYCPTINNPSFYTP